MRAAVVALALMALPSVVGAQTTPTGASVGASVGMSPETPQEAHEATPSEDLAALLRASTWRLERPGGGGLAVMVASDGLVASTSQVVGDVGAGCRVPLVDSLGDETDAELLVAEVVDDTVLLRARSEAGRRGGLRIAARDPAVGDRVFALGGGGEDAPLLSGRVVSHAGGEVRVRFDGGLPSPRALGGAVTDVDGHVLGLLERLPGSRSLVTLTPLRSLRSILPTLHREDPTPLCVPPYGASLGAAWHLGFEVAGSVPTRGDTHTVYPVRLTAMFFERWYLRMGVGVALGTLVAGHASLSGGPVLFRTAGDGVVGLGARVDAELGPFGEGFGPRREYYGLEIQATGYLSPALGIAVNLTGGVDRRWAPGQTDADYGASVSIGVGLVARTKRN